MKGEIVQLTIRVTNELYKELAHTAINLDENIKEFVTTAIIERIKNIKEGK